MSAMARTNTTTCEHSDLQTHARQCRPEEKVRLAASDRMRYRVMQCDEMQIEPHLRQGS